MLGYLVTSATVLVGLYLARFFQFLPWSTPVNIISTVVVPFALIVIGLVRAEIARRRAERQSAADALSAVEHHLTHRS